MLQVPDMQRTVILAVCAFAFLIAFQQVSAGAKQFISIPALLQVWLPTYGNIVLLPPQPNVCCPGACSLFSDIKLHTLDCAC